MIETLLTASERLQGQVHHTPVMTSATLNSQLGAEIFFKCENLQKIGAFKYRGAFNAISQLSDRQRARGVIAYSSGNHAQAVAKVGQGFGLRTVIVMPDNAPEIKRRATLSYGAKIVLYDAAQEDRELVTATLVEKHGYSLIPPFDHPDIIAGQGTAALEFHHSTTLDQLLVPCGGGGLLSGSALATKHARSSCRLIGVEPEQADDATRSFYSRSLQRIEQPQTIADGTRTPSLGALTFPLILEHVDAMVTVSERAIMEAVAWLFHRMKLVVEPSGALGLAALQSGALTAEGRVGIILSGGNIDAKTLTEIIASLPPD